MKVVSNENWKSLMTQKKKFCPSCGLKISSRSLYCKSCGKPQTIPHSEINLTTKKRFSSKKFWIPLFILLPVIIFFILFFKFPVPFSGKELIKKYGPSIVLIQVIGENEEDSAFGSGVVISGDGIILTNSHVLENFKTGLVKTATGAYYPIKEILREDLYFDLSTLKVDTNDLTPVKINPFDEIEIGEKVYAIGNPEGYSNTLSVGIISGIRKFEDKIMIQTTAPISQGSSGGALVDKKGKIIGITTLFNIEGQNLNFAVPMKYALSLIYKDTFLEDPNSKIPKDEMEKYIKSEKIILKDMEETLSINKAQLKEDIERVKKAKKGSSKEDLETITNYVELLKLASSYEDRKNILERIINKKNDFWSD